MTTPSLVGRTAELEQIQQLIDRCSHTGEVLTVSGAAGIGKSSLLDAAAEYARQSGRLVLHATGVETETHLPFAALHDLLRPVLGDAERLPTAQRRALLAAFGLADGTAPEPFLIALAGLNLLVEVAGRRPVVVIADDVQWLDHVSQETLSFVARRIDLDPVAIIVGVRDGHSGPLTRLAASRLQLEGLDDESATELLNGCAPDLDPADRARILRDAVGNPLALVELPAAVRSARTEITGPLPRSLPLPARLEAAFADRLTGLPAEVRALLLVTAIDDVDELPEIVEASSALAGRTVGVEDLAVAAEPGLIHFDELTIRFRHPLVRSAVLQLEPPRRRYAASSALATVLADQPYRRAWHRAQAVLGPDDELADELEQVAAASVSRGAIQAAIWALERSAQLTTASTNRGRRLLLAAQHAFGLGQADVVNRLLTSAATTGMSRLERARMEWLSEIFNDGVPGDAKRVHALAGLAKECAGGGDTDLALNLLLGAALRCWWAETGPAARAAVADVVSSLDGLEEDPRYVAALAVAEPVLRAAEVQRLLSRVMLEEISDAEALRVLGMSAHAVGAQALAADILDRSEAKLREQGRLGLLPHVLAMGANARFCLGDFDRAQAAVEEANRLAEETGQPIWSTGSLSLDAMVSAVRGQTERALTLAAEAEHAANSRGLGNLLACAHLARGFAYAGEGRHHDALEQLLPLYTPGTPCYHQRESFCGLICLAEAAAHANRLDEGRGVLARMEAVAEITPSPLLHVNLLYARAALAGDDTAETLYRDGLNADLTRWPWPKARLELAYGTWLRRHRRVVEARGPLRSALTVLELIGAPRWADQARAELRAAGEQPTTGPAALNDLLSAQELQIARMAAQGLSNRQIGERLYLSPRTVGSHLYRIFPKLNITSRSQLATHLDRSEPPPA